MNIDSRTYSRTFDPTTVAALIPAYQEAAHIREVAMRARNELATVLIVDDGSTDATWQEACESGAEVLRHEVNSGKGAAIKTGLRTLLERGYQYVIILDGDGQHRPEEIPRFLQSASESPGIQLFIGSRMRDLATMPPVRRWTNRYMSWQISLFCGTSIPDTQCGFRMIHRSLIPHLFCESNAYDYETEMILIAGRAGCSIGSVPITTIYADETSRIRPVRDTIRFFRLLARYTGSKAEAYGSGTTTASARKAS